MDQNALFRREFIKTALPIAFQGVFQASFSAADQIMAGQLGSVAVAGIGLGGKFSSLYCVILAAVATAAGILIAQYIENADPRFASRSFYQNLIFMLALALGFTAISLCFAPTIMGLYSEDKQTVEAAASYLSILAWSFVPMAVTSIFSVYLRCKGAAIIALYAGIGAAVLNTLLNYALIFGKLGLPELGIRGAALATVLSQLCGCVVTVILFLLRGRREKWRMPVCFKMGKNGCLQYAAILLPILVCELFWSLGENIYAGVYGHIGTQACAAMTLTNPVQALMMGALNGIAQAAGILVGKQLGCGSFEGAYASSKRLMKYGLAASAVLCVILIPVRGLYAKIFNVEAEVRDITVRLLLIYAIVAPVKVQNMILGGGILRSGGKTKYVMAVDLIGTWLFGVPLAYLSAFAFDLSVPLVYFILSQEELVRLLISIWIFRRKIWMNSLA